ncbi:MAG: Gfo/Idh/MocA family oxidoreductase [Candidatus Nealsonbacteria bacterium]|nr:Gfo/Idh/MocA family oxidoreductase [Candidatus Nealsonbacteria bacterium]
MKSASAVIPCRRRFLATALGFVAGPSVIPGSALGRDNQTAPGERIAIGCIGLGNRGPQLMKALLGQGDARVVAVCDVSGRQREAARQLVDRHYGDRGCTAYNDFRELCGRADIDAVSIASPDHWHVLHSLEAIHNGKDCYTEKALGLSLADDKALRAACHRYGTVFQWGTQQRSDENFRFGCELVLGGRIGELQTILVGVPHDFAFPNQPTQPVPKDLDYDLWLGPAPWAPYTYHRCRPWNKQESYSIWYHISDYCLGGIGGYWGIHHLDIAQWGHGTDHTGPVEVEGTATFPDDGLADCAIAWKVRHTYADGVTMVYTDNKQNKQGVVFQGTEGWVYVRRGHIDAQPKSLLNSQVGPGEIHLPRSPGHQREFLDCIRSRKPTISNIDVAVRSDTLSHLTDVCTRLRRKIRWDPQRETILDDADARRMLTRAKRTIW